MIELSLEEKGRLGEGREQWGARCKVEGGFQWHKNLEIERSMREHGPLRKSKTIKAKSYVMDTGCEKRGILTCFR